MSNLPIYEVLAHAFASEDADLGELESLMQAYDSRGPAEIWNIPISDRVTSPSMRRQTARGHGVM